MKVAELLCSCCIQCFVLCGLSLSCLSVCLSVCVCVPLTTCIDIMRQQTVSVVCVLARAKRYQVITQSIAKYACMLPECNAMLPTAVYCGIETVNSPTVWHWPIHWRPQMAKSLHLTPDPFPHFSSWLNHFWLFQGSKCLSIVHDCGRLCIDCLCMLCMFLRGEVPAHISCMTINTTCSTQFLR